MLDPSSTTTALGSLFLGASLGIASGVSPGPLSALVLSSTLEDGLAAGLRVCVAPLVTDLLMLGSASFLLTRLGPEALSIVSLVGGTVVILIGISTFRQANKHLSEEETLLLRTSTPWADLAKGATVNLLNPHPWLFWMVVGGPAVTTAWQSAPIQGILFFGVFELCLVGSKAGLAALVAHQRDRLRGNAFRWALRGLGLLLVVFGGQLLWRGFAHGR